MILRLLRFLMIYRFYLVILAVFILCLCLARVFGVFGEHKKKMKLAASAGCGSLTSRISEAVMLGCIAAVVILLMALVQFKRFDMLRASPDVIELFTHFNIGLGCFAFFGIMLCVLWRTIPGFILVTVVCVISFLYSAGIIDRVEPFGIKTEAAKSVLLTISVKRDDGRDTYEGVDVWVNDVYLGKTPIRMTLNKFLDTVPYWPSAPEQANETIAPKNMSYRDYSGWSSSKRNRPVTFRIPEMPQDDEFIYDINEKDGSSLKRDAIRERAKTTEKQRTYYARFEYVGHVGYGNYPGGDGYGSSGSGGRISYSANYNFYIRFPSHTKSIENLLDAARMRDYQINEKWCRAMDAYGIEGWKAMRNAAYMDWINRKEGYYHSILEPYPSEKGMLKVMDAYVSWRYELENLNSTSAAWKAFKRLCKSVDAADYYSYNSVEGHALGLIVDKLDHKRLVNDAVRRIRKESFRLMGFFHHFTWGKGLFQSPSAPKDRHGPASDYLVMDAVWRLDRQLDNIDDSKPNIVEQKVSKAIIACHAPLGYRAMLLACRIGGPDLLDNLEKFRLADQKKDRRFRIGFSTSGLHEVDMLLNLMVNVSGSEGEDFRSENKKDVDQIIENIVRGREGEDAFVFGHLDFLSLDIGLGKQSSAAKFWPKYFQIVKDSKDSSNNDKLRRMWNYLIRLEPVFGVDTYVKSWQNSVDRYGHCRYTPYLLDMVAPEKRKLIAQALKRELELRPENIMHHNEDKIDTSKVNSLQKALDRMIAETDDNDFAAYIIKDIKRYRGGLHIIEWLIAKRPGHIVGEMMAESDDVALRKKAVELLKEHPTPGRAEILKRLADDTDDEVKLSAKKALEELEKIYIEVWK